jgi:hypothetical protein
MNVTAIQMDPAEAREKLTQYRTVLSNRHSQKIEAEFEAVERAYQELAKGTPLINPFMAIGQQGWRPDGRPVLAMARADQTKCDFQVGSNSRIWMEKTGFTGKWAPCDLVFTARRERWDRQRARNLRITVRATTEPPVDPKRGCAMVPLVPAEAYPTRGLDLAKHFVLWEVEDWDVAPPVDPMLLRPIGGDLYAVIHQWNLTDIERMVIAGTRS